MDRALSLLQRPPRGLVWFLVGAFVMAFALRGCSPQHPTPSVLPRPDTASASAYQARVQELKQAVAEREGTISRLSARLKAQEQRRPERIVVYDTVIDVRRDTVILGVQQDIDGRLTLDIATPDSLGHVPETRTGIRLSDCDDGWTIRAGSVLCDRARLGHLSLFARGGAAYATDTGAISPALSAGLEWTPSYRSQWSIRSELRSDGRVEVSVAKAFRLF